MSICGTSASAHPSAFVAAGDTGVRGLSLQRIRACAGGCIYTVASVFMQNGQSHIRINAILVVYEFLGILRSGQRSHNQAVWVTVAETQLGVNAAHVFSTNGFARFFSWFLTLYCFFGFRRNGLDFYGFCGLCSLPSFR